MKFCVTSGQALLDRMSVVIEGNKYLKSSQERRRKWKALAENIWDDLLLLDVNPNGLYLTHIPHSEMCFGKERHIILEKKSTKHLSGWKFDSSRASLTKGLKAGITIYIDVDNDGNISDDDNIKLRRFIVEKFTN